MHHLERDCSHDPEDCDLGFLHVNNSQEPKKATEQIGIDRGLQDKLRFFSQFAAASYWPGQQKLDKRSAEVLWW